MLKFLKSLFGIESPKPVATPATVDNTVPYKVPEPAPVTSVPLQVLTVTPVAGGHVTEVKPTAKPVAKPAAKPVAKPTAKPAVLTAKPAQKPNAKAKAPAKPQAPSTKKPKISIAK